MRTTIRSLGKALAVPVLATALAVSAAVPANAATDYDVTTGTRLTSGKANAAGDLTWRPRAVSFKGFVRDLCGTDPTGDGYRAVVAFQAVLANGTTSQEIRREDHNGCSNGKVHYDTGFRSPSSRIKGLRITVCEVNGSSGTVGDCARTYEDNPTW